MSPSVLSFAPSAPLPLHQSSRLSHTPHQRPRPPFRRRPRSALIASASPQPLPGLLQALAENLSSLPTAAARYRALIALGDTLTPTHLLARTDQRPSTRIAACNSNTHLLVRVIDGTVRLSGASDAKVSLGFLALLVAGLDGAPALDVAALTVESLNAATGLDVARMPSRALGLAGLLDAVHKGIEGRDEKEERVLYTSVAAGEVAVLLSGGVDSSVAMRKVQDAGFKPRPFYLKIWLEDELAHLGTCPWEEDIEYAEAVCQQAGVQLETVSMQREYWERVVSYTIDEARRGRTPNPDIMCNTRVKFGAFYDEVGTHFERVVTGHYARKDVCDGLARLRMSPDLVKDQTYFLASLSQEQLAKAEFPLGVFEKSAVRTMAEEYMLPNRARKDSQGICFLGKLKFDDFLAHHLGTKRGLLVEYETGVTLGEHRGFWFYTMGQRKGVGLSGGPWHVVSKSPEENIVYVSRNYRQETAARRNFGFDAVSWIAGAWPTGLESVGDSTELRVKTRHGPTITDCVVTRSGLDAGTVEMDPDAQAQALAPGQFAVFYAADGVCLGSGRLTSDREILAAAHSVSGLVTEKRLQAHYTS